MMSQKQLRKLLEQAKQRILRELLGLHKQGSLVVKTALSLTILASLSGCISKQEINAALFVHEQIPESFCKQIPELNKLGVYRIFKCNAAYVEAGICRPGQELVRERMSYCKPGIKTHFSVKDSELREILIKAGIK